MNDLEIERLQWPNDRWMIGNLSIVAFQQWYLLQNPQYMIWLGQDKQFKRFLYWHYTLPVKLLRLYYRVKRMFTHG